VKFWVCAQHTTPDRKVCTILRVDVEKVLCALDRKGGGKRAVSMTKPAVNRIHLRNLSVTQRRVESLTAPEVQHLGSLQCVRRI